MLISRHGRRSVSEAAARLNFPQVKLCCLTITTAGKYMPFVPCPVFANIRKPKPSRGTFFDRCRKKWLEHLSDNAVEALLEPLDGLLALDLVARADAALAAAAGGDALTLAGHADVEVHAVDTDGGVVLDTKIDVLADTEAEVASLGEVALAQLVLLDLEATLKNLLSLRQVSLPIPHFCSFSVFEIVPWGHGR